MTTDKEKTQAQKNSSVSKGEVITSHSGKIGVIEFFHPKANSLPSNLLKEIALQITHFSKNPEISVIHLKSRGIKAFCAGASFDELVCLDTLDEATDYFMGFAGIILAMRESSKIIVTTVQGKGVGGAVGLIAAADYVIGDSGAMVRLSELNIGIAPFVISEPILRRIGERNFSALSLDTEWRDARWCLQTGLFSKVSDNLLEDEKKLFLTLEKANSRALRELKEIFWSNAGNLPALLKTRAKLSAECLLTPQVQDIIKDLLSS